MSTYLHFDLGSNLDAYRSVLDELRRHSSKPSEIVFSGEHSPHYTISAPIHMKSELEKLMAEIGRLVDDLDYRPCTIELRHVLSRISSDGRQVTPRRLNGAWHNAKTKYVASYPRVTETHHTVIVPKNGHHPPSARDGWLLIEQPDAWHFYLRSARNGTDLKRDREKIASLYKGVAGVMIDSRVEQVSARWMAPMQPTPDNEYKVSHRRLIGVSPVREAFDYQENYAEIQANHAHRILSADEMHRRSIANLEPCRRIAEAKGFTVYVAGVGLIPLVPEDGRYVFGNPFCARGVSYGRTEEEARLLIEGFDEFIFNLVAYGRSPMMAPAWHFGRVAMCRELLDPSRAGKKKTAPAKSRPAERNFFGTTEHVDVIKPTQEYKTMDQVTRTLWREWFGEEADFRDLGMLAIPFRSERDNTGRRIGGSLFMLVHSPNLTLERLDYLSLCEIAFLYMSGLLSEGESEQHIAPVVTAKQKDREFRAAQAVDHNRLFNGFVAVWDKRGSRLAELENRFRGAYAVYRKYQHKLKGFKDAIETSDQKGEFRKDLWAAMTDTSRDYLWQARKWAGLSGDDEESKEKPTEKKKSKAASSRR